MRDRHNTLIDPKCTHCDEFIRGKRGMSEAQASEAHVLLHCTAVNAEQRLALQKVWKYPCCLCQYKAKNRRALGEHIKAKHKDAVHKCGGLCGRCGEHLQLRKGWRATFAAEMHRLECKALKTEERKPKRHICKHCDYEATTRKLLRIHFYTKRHKSALNKTTLNGILNFPALAEGNKVTDQL